MSEYTEIAPPATPGSKTAFVAEREEGKSEASSRLLLALLLLCGALVYAYAVLKSGLVVGGQRYFILNDDAMISMRYAYNLAHGQGFVWNPGDHVQGYTNLGWTLVMAAIHFLHLPLGMNGLVIELLNMGLHLALVACVFAFLRPRCGLAVAFGAAFLLDFNPVLFDWATKGLENTLQMLLITMALLRLLPLGKRADLRANRLYLVPLLCALAFVVRPDSLLFFVAGTLVAFDALRQCDGEARAKEQKSLLIATLAGMGIVAGVLLWQKTYYGDWLPNTFYLKATGSHRLSRAVTYLQKFAFDDWQIVTLLGGAGFLARGLADRATRRQTLGMAAVVVTWFVYVALIGGDVLRHSRFYTPVIPILVIATVAFLFSWSSEQSSASAESRFRLSAAALALLIAFNLGTFYFILKQSKNKIQGNILPRIETAVALQQSNLPAGSVFGVFEQGAIPYLLPNYRFHDLLGNSDAHIAHTAAHWGPPGHDRWDYDYSLGVVQPDYIIGTSGDVSEADQRRQLAAKQDMGYFPALILHPLFRRDYAPNHLPLRVGGGEQKPNLWIYARK